MRFINNKSIIVVLDNIPLIKDQQIMSTCLLHEGNDINLKVSS